MSYKHDRRELGYGDLRYLKQLVSMAYLECLAFPHRKEEILTALRKDAEALHEAYAFEVNFRRLLLRKAENAAERAEARYHRARFRVKQQAQRITDHWISEQVRDGFDPNGWFVYLIWGESTNCPIYVGRSRNILGRIGTHASSSPFREQIRRVTLIRCDTDEQMRLTEEQLIDQYQPEYNRAGKREESLPFESRYRSVAGMNGDLR